MPATPSKVLLFLGSGVSRPSGMDGVREITNHVLNDRLTYRGSGEFSAYDPSAPALPGYELVAKHAQSFLRLLKAYADRYYCTRNGQESHYEDIFYLARQIGDDRLGEVDNPAIDGFVREVLDQAQPLLRSLVDVVNSEERYQTLAKRACRIITHVVADRLQTPKVILGYDLLGEIAGDAAIGQLDLVTLNHDVLAETYLSGIGQTFIDGFEKVAGSDVRKFNSSLFDRGARIRLLKPHGSLNWHRYFDNATSADWFGIPTNGDATHVKDAAGNLIPWAEGPLFLAGTFNKILDYGSGIFAEQFFRFHQFLKSHELVVVSGYGFSDKGINARLWDWLFENQTRKLVILHADPDSLFANARGSLSNAFQRAGDQRILVVKKWMQHADWTRDIVPLVHP